MSVVVINAITVPEENAEALEQRFGQRAGEVAAVAGFEALELLRPSDDRDVYLVYTRWASTEAYDAWVASRPPHQGDRITTANVLWSFDVVQHEDSAPGAARS